MVRLSSSKSTSGVSPPPFLLNIMMCSSPACSRGKKSVHLCYFVSSSNKLFQAVIYLNFKVYTLNILGLVWRVDLDL
jgi:hypothetical protein